jgi:hypothetical protein
MTEKSKAMHKHLHQENVATARSELRKEMNK